MSFDSLFHRSSLDALWNGLQGQNSIDIGREEWNRLFQRGEFVYFKNTRRSNAPLGVGQTFPTRVNVNIGTSDAYPDLAPELLKLELAEKLGADAVMDLSTGGDLPAIRKTMLARTKLPVGTVPIYQMYLEAIARYGDFAKMTAVEMLDVIASQAAEGVDFMTIHAGITLEDARRLREQSRLMGSVSRGGSFLIHWMLQNKRENPFLDVWGRTFVYLARI
jgi:phosphomethylpyrimidine synthase